MSKTKDNPPNPHEIWVPATFWDDHRDRCPSDDGEAGIASEIRRVGAKVLIRGSAAQIGCLRSDAEFYTDRLGPDASPTALKRSAAATLKSIKQALATHSGAAR